MKFSDEFTIESDVPSNIPKNKRSLGFFGAFFALMIWIVMSVVFVFVLYVNWVSRSVSLLCEIFSTKRISVPFWLSAIAVIFFFPFTLIVVMISTALKLWKNDAKI